MTLRQQIKPDDFVKTRGTVSAEKMGTVAPWRTELAIVTAVEGDSVTVMPGSFDGAGRWGRTRDYRVVRRKDVKKVKPPERFR